MDDVAVELRQPSIERGEAATPLACELGKIPTGFMGVLTRLGAVAL